MKYRAQPKIDLSSKTKIAFICSGGAVKAAAFHMGVAMALEHDGFIFEGGLSHESSELGSSDPSKTISSYVGSSAGCLITSYLANGGGIKDILSAFQSDPSWDGLPGMKYWEMLSPRVRKASDFLGWNNFFVRMFKNRAFQSPFSTEGIVRYLNSHVLKTDRFSELRSDLYIVATELNRPLKVIFGKKRLENTDPAYEYRDDVSILDACAASMSLPPIYHPYTIELDGIRRDFYDGEIWEPLSAHVGRDLGCDLVICSYTHQPLRLPMNKGLSLANMGVELVTLQAVYQMIEQKIRAARGTRKREKELIDLVKRFFRDNELPDSALDKLVALLEERMIYKPNIDYIYIHPRSTDLEMFAAPHFSLKRSTTEEIVRKGYIAGRVAMRQMFLSP
jgi:predicted acylesterase/phospholipase RssA